MAFYYSWILNILELRSALEKQFWPGLQEKTGTLDKLSEIPIVM